MPQILTIYWPVYIISVLVFWSLAKKRKNPQPAPQQKAPHYEVIISPVKCSDPQKETAIATELLIFFREKNPQQNEVWSKKIFTGHTLEEIAYLN